MGRGTLVIVVLAGACGDSTTCELPERTRYTCEPVPAGSVGCAGGPRWTPTAHRTDAAVYQDDAELSFPIGCHAEIPECNSLWPDSPRTFVCSPSEATESGGHWGELL